MPAAVIGGGGVVVHGQLIFFFTISKKHQLKASSETLIPVQHKGSLELKVTATEAAASHCYHLRPPSLFWTSPNKLKKPQRWDQTQSNDWLHHGMMKRDIQHDSIFSPSIPWCRQGSADTVWSYGLTKALMSRHTTTVFFSPKLPWVLCFLTVTAPGSIPESWEDRLLIPPKGVLGFGLERAGKAFAGDWGLLKAELSEVGKPGIFWLCDGAVPPRFKDPIPDRGSIWNQEMRLRHGA